MLFLKDSVCNKYIQKRGERSPLFLLISIMLLLQCSNVLYTLFIMFIKKVIKNLQEYNVWAVWNRGETSTNMYKNSTLYTFMPSQITPSYNITWSYRDASWVVTTITDVVSQWDTPTPPILPETSQSASTVYSFTWWSPSVAPATEDKTYTAQYATSTRKYAITWSYRNANWTVTTTTNNVDYWTTPTAPTLPSTCQSASTVYTFTSWDSQITTVTWDKTYTAQYTEATRKYNITWTYRNSSWTVTSVTNSEDYWATPTAPSLPQTSQSTSTVYTFTGWNSQITQVTSAKTYTAQYTETARNYQITFTYRASDWEWTSSRSNVPYWTVPTAPTLPSSCESDTTVYTFTDWDTAIVAVTWTKTYTAQYTERPIWRVDPVIDFLLVWGWGWGWRWRYRWWGWWGWWWILYCEWYTVTENHTVCIWSWWVWASNKCNACCLAWCWSSFWTYTVLWWGWGWWGYSNTVWCIWWNWFSWWGWAWCCKAWWTWDWWKNWWNWSAYAWWWGWWWCTVWCNASWSYWQWKWWCWYCSTISWSAVRYWSWWTWWWCCDCPWICWWWKWWIAKWAWCNAETCWSWWWGWWSTRANNCCVSWGSWANWVFIARYPKDCPYCLSWGCVYECWNYKIHCFTSNWTLCVNN